jgi:site-specific recombinase XerD
MEKSDAGSGTATSDAALDDHVERFLEQLRAEGYAQISMQRRRGVVLAFLRWAGRHCIPVDELQEAHAIAFVARSTRRAKDRVHVERSATRHFVRFLRGDAGRPGGWVKHSAGSASVIEQRYVDHLRRERGLAERSISVYAPYVRSFVAWLAARGRQPPLSGMTVADIREFLLEKMRGRSAEYSRLLTVAMRSLLRFLCVDGAVSADMSRAIPMMRPRRPSVLRRALTPPEVERILATADLATRRGRRDRAILLLLARLGLRAGEVTTLELGDIHWRAAEVLVRGKGRLHDRLPLPADVGVALAVHLREDRAGAASRRVFLRLSAPRVGFAGPCAVSAIVRLALARAGIQRPPRAAAHLLRHSLATRMVRAGASLEEIGEVLRHRSRATTELYAQVDFDALRNVARPWPLAGGSL